jgi:regulation of enolase protein 1 (concanavalin A-like superfamily)
VNATRRCIGGAILALAFALLSIVPAAKGDPTVTGGGQGSLDVVWNFQNPANYTAADVEIRGGQASLRRIPGALNFTTQSEFATYASVTNIDLGRRPGAVLLNRTSGPLPATATYTSRLVGDGRSVSWNAIAWNASSFDDHSDEFGGTSLDPHWRWFNPPASYAVGAPRPGWLTFNASRPTDFWNGATSGQFLYQSVSGEFQLEARLQTSPLAASGQKAGILVMLPPPFNPTTFWASAHRVYSAGVRVQAVTTFNSNTFVNATIVADPEYFMIRRTANGSLETYFGSDGRNWTFLAYVGFGNPPTTLWVGVFSGNPSAGIPLTVNVDYVRFSFPDANPQVQVETRTGNVTNTADPSWTPWSVPHSNKFGSRIDRRAAYLQYRLLLFTSSFYVRPLVGDVNLSWEYRPSTGEVATQDFAVGRSLAWDVLALEVNLRGGTVEVSYSLNGSAVWTSVPPAGPNVTVARALRLHLRLSTPDASVSPSVMSIRVGLRPGPEPPSPFPFWLLMVPLGLFPAWLLAARLLRGPFKATDLFLIHADGRLVLHVGGRHILIRDEIAASGMLTLVTRFVKDSFGGTGGSGGELRSLQIDEREIAIAKGEYLFLALVAHGPRPKHLESLMSDFLRAIEQAHRPSLEAWTGLGEDLGDLKGQLHWFLRKGHRHVHLTLPGRRSRT